MILAPRSAAAAWPSDPNVNVPICSVETDQSPASMVADGAGGAITTWSERRISDHFDVYAQHVLANGSLDPSWPVDGRPLCTAVGSQEGGIIVADGAGGAFVAWQDYRVGNGADIYVQHVLANGTVDPAWPNDGRAVCTAPGYEGQASMLTDGAGGAIVVWQDWREVVITGGSNSDIYAQHILADGTIDPTWPANGRAVCTHKSQQGSPRIVSDGTGGAVVAWEDFRNATDIYAQRVLSSGVVDPTWPANGLAVCTAPSSKQGPTIASDGAGGAIVTWYDHRNAVGDANWDIYAQRVLVSGTVDPAWPVNGRALCTLTTYKYDPAIVADGSGGAIVAGRIRVTTASTSTPSTYCQTVRSIPCGQSMAALCAPPRVNDHLRVLLPTALEVPLSPGTFAVGSRRDPPTTSTPSMFYRVVRLISLGPPKAVPCPLLLTPSLTPSSLLTGPGVRSSSGPIIGTTQGEKTRSPTSTRSGCRRTANSVATGLLLHCCRS